MDAAALDDLEGIGQSKRLTARICAELHNAIRIYAWHTKTPANTPAPALMDESRFLPKRRKTHHKMPGKPPPTRAERLATQMRNLFH